MYIYIVQIVFIVQYISSMQFLIYTVTDELVFKYSVYMCMYSVLKKVVINFLHRRPKTTAHCRKKNLVDVMYIRLYKPLKYASDL